MTFRPPRSMFGQLLLAQLALLLLLALGLPVLVLTTLHQTADEFVARRLRHDADAIAAVMAGAGPGAPARMPWFAPGPRSPGSPPWLGRPNPGLRQPPGGRAYRATSDGGRVLAEGGTVALLPALPPLTQDSFYQRVGHIDVFRRRFAFHGGRGTVEVAQDRSHPEVIVDDVVASFLRRVLWIIPLILAASTAAGLLIVRRVTRQLGEASAAADAIQPSALDARLDLAVLPREARGLASAANSALDRVAAGYRRQSAFAASVAHELRTPMALLALRCDALPPSDTRDSLREAIDQASRVVSQLMELARVENQAPALDPIDLAATAREAVERAAPLVFRSGRCIDLDEPHVLRPALGNHGLLHIALANIIDNAIRHTPPGTRIRVSVEGAAVCVADNGAGIVVGADGSFLTAGDARTDSAGLGLAIVQRIVAAMAGRLEVASGEAGARLTIRLTPA